MGCDALVLVDLTRHVLRAQNLYAFCSALINHFLSKTDWKTYKKRGATQGLPRRSPVLVLLTPTLLNYRVLMESGASVLV